MSILTSNNFSKKKIKTRTLTKKPSEQKANTREDYPPSPLESQSSLTGEDWRMIQICVDMLGEPWFFIREMQPLLA